jgi:integrase
MEAKLRSELHAQIFLGEKQRLPLGEALFRYAKQKEGTPNHANVIGHMRTILDVLEPKLFLDQLRSDDIESLLQKRREDGVRPQTLKHCLSVIKGTIKLARSQQFRVPELEFLPIRVANARLRYLSMDEERRLLAALDPHRNGPGLFRSSNREPELRRQLQDLYDLVVLLLDTGARCGEIRKLEWQHIDLEAGLIHLWRSKVSNESLLHMTARARNILARRKQCATGRYVFTNKKRGMRNHQHASWRKAFDRAGLQDCTIHTLRHTHASRLIQNGMTLYDVQTVLGHSDPKTTMRYAHLEKVAVTAKARAVIDELHVSARLL